jgi:hypothetical protein
MSIQRLSNKTNARVIPQNRIQGSGSGRRLMPWKRTYGWLLIAAEQLVVGQAGSEGALLENRSWMTTWGISSAWLARRVDKLFPGVYDHLTTLDVSEVGWQNNLYNRVYKMYYNGTSARGTKHDPRTRASISIEHWRNWPTRVLWEEQVLRIVQRDVAYKQWHSLMNRSDR